MKKVERFQGILDGDTIRLDRPSVFTDGTRVDVVITMGDGLNTARTNRLERLFGSCADLADDLDQFMRWNQIQRRGTTQS